MFRFSFIGSIEDDYEILEELGRGSFAQVYKVKEKRNNPEFRAAKKIIINPMDNIDEPDKLKQFRSDHIIEY